MFNQTRLFSMLLLVCVNFHAFTAAAQQYDRQSSLDKLFIALEHSTSEHQAKQIEKLIWSFWLESENDQVNQLMQQLVEARDKRDYESAFNLADQIVMLEPDNAEGWNQRATVHFLMGNYDHSLDDIVETLKREPRHFGALSGRAYILMKQNKNRQAIETINTALKIHPFLGLRHRIPNSQNSLPL